MKLVRFFAGYVRRYIAWGLLALVAIPVYAVASTTLVALIEPIFGEVVVSGKTALREAEKRGLPVDRELALYAIHGVLHLVGFDDVEENFG